MAHYWSQNFLRHQLVLKGAGNEEFSNLQPFNKIWRVPKFPLLTTIQGAF